MSDEAAVQTEMLVQPVGEGLVQAGWVLPVVGTSHLEKVRLDKLT